MDLWVRRDGVHNGIAWAHDENDVFVMRHRTHGMHAMRMRDEYTGLGLHTTH